MPPHSNSGFIAVCLYVGQSAEEVSFGTFSSATRTRESLIGFNKRISLTHNPWATKCWVVRQGHFANPVKAATELPDSLDIIADREKLLDCNNARPVIKVISLHFSLTCGKEPCSWVIS
jgi:hypothetical protein